MRSWRREHLAWFPESGLQRGDLEYRRAQWAELLNDDSDLETYLGFVDGEAAGVLRLGVSAEPSEPGIGETHALYVVPEHWHRGVGTALIAFGEERLRELGFDRAIAWAYELNPRALDFYAGRGYERGESLTNPRGDHGLVEVPFLKRLL